jgi:hypothetical protein
MGRNEESVEDAPERLALIVALGERRRQRLAKTRAVFETDDLHGARRVEQLGG